MPFEHSPKKNALGKHPGEAESKGTFPFSSWVYRQRNLVERFFDKLKQLRGIATRYEKDPRNFFPPSNSLQHAYGSGRYESMP
jgi:transposase